MARLEKRRRLYYAVRDVPKSLQRKLRKRRFLKTTGTGNRSEAELIAATLDVSWLEQIERARNGARTQETREDSEARVYRRAAFWRDRLRHTAASSRPTVIERVKEEAREELNPYDPDDPEGIRLAELFVELVHGDHLPLAERVEEFLALKAKDATPKTIDLYRESLTRFCQRFPNSSDVTKQEIKQWIRELRDEVIADKTLQRTLSAVRGYWRYLQDQGEVPETVDPFAGAMKTIETGKNRRGKVQSYKPFEPLDVVRLLRSAEAKGDEQLANLIRLGMWTGCRIDSLCSLPVENASGGTLRVSDKTEAGDRVIPVHPQLKPTLDALCASSTDGFVLSGLTANKYGSRSNAIGKRFGRLKKQSGFVDRSWAFHSIRKTVVTQLQQAGVSEDITMSIVGHENSSITYGLYSAGPSMEQKRVAIEKLAYPVG